MAAQTGRTVSKWVNFQCDDSAGTLRTIPINSLSIVGLVYEEQDVTAWQDAVKSALPGMPDAPIEISGPFDNAIAAVAGTLSGSHTVLSAINGVATPLTLDVQIGIRHAWVADEPQFGITATAANGYICTSYTVNPSDMTYSAKFVLYPGSIAPAWGTAAET
jgi:hypothetical protein